MLGNADRIPPQFIGIAHKHRELRDEENYSRSFSYLPVRVRPVRLRKNRLGADAAEEQPAFRSEGTEACRAECGSERKEVSNRPYGSNWRADHPIQSHRRHNYFEGPEGRAHRQHV